MYKSPIEIKWNDIVSDAVGKGDEYILRCVQQVGVNVDRDELIKALEYDRGQYEKGWNDRDSEIVRCKDCCFCVYDEKIDEMWCRGKKVSKDWFCADGKREERLIMPKADGSTIRTRTIPKDGYWVHGKELSRDYIGDVCVGIHYDKLWCSECNYQLEEDEPLWRYCPRCGAKMDEVKSEIWQD